MQVRLGHQTKGCLGRGAGRKPSEQARTRPRGCSGAWEVGNQILNSVTGGMAASLQRRGTQREGADGRSCVWARGTRGAGRRVTGIPSRQLRPGVPRGCGRVRMGEGRAGRRKLRGAEQQKPRVRRSSVQRAGLLCVRQSGENICRSDFSTGSSGSFEWMTCGCLGPAPVLGSKMPYVLICTLLCI